MTICKKNLIYLRIDKAKQTLVNLPLLGGIIRRFVSSYYASWRKWHLKRDETRKNYNIKKHIKMDLKDQLKLIADRTKHKENIQTEEATKNAFIMPFLQCLGYDVFNPLKLFRNLSQILELKKAKKLITQFSKMDIQQF